MRFPMGKNFRWTLLAPMLAITLATMPPTGKAEAQIPQFKIENPDSGHKARLMGWSIAVDGDTMVVGAPFAPSSPYPTEAAGKDVVWVYKKNSLGIWTFQAELIASDAEAYDMFGCSVSISGDTVVVGAYWDDDGGSLSGSAYVFTRSGSDWSEQQKLIASDATGYDWFGHSVSISGDTVVVGADGYVGEGSIGSAYVFSRSGGIWTQQQKLNAFDAEDGDRFGHSVSISGDSLIVGAAEANGNSGSAYVYSLSEGIWIEKQKLIASDKGRAYFGSSVSISGDTLVVGADWDSYGNNPSGSAYIFTRSNDVWRQEQKLSASDAMAEDNFGHSVSISRDTIVVGAFSNNVVGDYSGSSYVFMRSGGVWREQQKLIASDGKENDGFGKSVSISGDTVVVGAPWNDYAGNASGSAYVFTHSGTAWNEQQILNASDAAGDDWFGQSVSISGDTAIIGTPLDGDKGYKSGSVYIFNRLGGIWTQQQKLTAPDATASDRFGASVSISDDTAIIGTPNDTDAGYDSGSVYVFTRSDGVWTQQQKLLASDAKDYNLFGHSVSISGDTLIVGAFWNDQAGFASGSSYVFTRSDGVWREQQKLTASDAADHDYFGYSVSISGDTVVVGASGNDDGGSAYVFMRSDVVWTQQQKLTVSDTAVFDDFGHSVSISGDMVAVGVPGDSDAGSGSGSIYVFTRSGNSWIKQQKLVAPDVRRADKFGYSVSLSEDTLIVGVSGDDDGRNDSGSAYVFTHSDGVWSIRAKLIADDASESDSFGYSVAVDGEQVIVGAPYNDDPETDSGAAYVFDISDMPAFTLAGPPVLGDVAVGGNGLLDLTWANSSQSPVQTWGFAWDLYIAGWVDREANGIWYSLASASATSGEMGLGHSGAYHVWVASQYANGAWYPCENPATVLLNQSDAPPHRPLDVTATDKGGRVVTVTWKPEVYGTWLYWIIAYDVNANQWVALDGPAGQSVWQYVVYDSDAYNAGSADLTVPATGDYRFFIQGLAWDATTPGEFASTPLPTTVQ